MGRALRLVPSAGDLDFGDFRRTAPISADFGVDRGHAIDRYYIERFLEEHAADVHGRVLEIGNDEYTRRYGGDRVSGTDIWHAHDRNPKATLVGDLANAPQAPSDTFDCVILTQTLQFIYDPRAALATLNRMLKPRGTLLMTIPGISQVATRSEWGPTWYWAFTCLGVQRMLDETFGAGQCSVRTRGNVLAATSFLHGLAAEELTESELERVDPDYQVIITARAQRSSGA
jgi:SAM-dependent methyltransferase